MIQKIGLIGLASMAILTGCSDDRTVSRDVPRGAPSATQKASNSSVRFSISDDLGEGQVSESVEISINGKNMGILSIDESNPSATLEITADQPGNVSYSVSCVSNFRTSDGEVTRLSGVGQGMIEIQNGKSFVLEGAISGTNFQVTIKEK